MMFFKTCLIRIPEPCTQINKKHSQVEKKMGSQKLEHTTQEVEEGRSKFRKKKKIKIKAKIN